MPLGVHRSGDEKGRSVNDDNRHDLDKTLQDLGIGVDDDAGAATPDVHDDLGLGDPLPLQGVVPAEGDPRERAESFLVNLLLNVDPAYAVDVHEIDDSEIAADIYGGDAGRLIGKGGRTLSALEQITNAVINRSDGPSVRVNVDVGGYKRRRDDRLRDTAHKAADQVRTLGEPVELDPMSAAERRVVHMAVADEVDIISESAGEGRDRRVVLKPAPL